MKLIRGLRSVSCAVGALLPACGDGMVTDDRCLVNLAPITARTDVVTVGDTVTFHAMLGPAACLPAGITTEDWRWSSLDTLTASIDSTTGIAEGVSPGDAVIQVRHARNAAVSSSASLRVVSAGAGSRPSSVGVP